MEFIPFDDKYKTYPLHWKISGYAIDLQQIAEYCWIINVVIRAPCKLYVHLYMPHTHKNRRTQYWIHVLKSHIHGNRLKKFCSTDVTAVAGVWGVRERLLPFGRVRKILHSRVSPRRFFCLILVFFFCFVVFLLFFLLFFTRIEAYAFMCE